MFVREGLENSSCCLLRFSLFLFYPSPVRQRVSECSRTSALPSLASLTSQVASSLPAARNHSVATSIEHVIGERFARTACAWRAAYAQSWQPDARRADLLRPKDAHILTATRALVAAGAGTGVSGSGGGDGATADAAGGVEWAADEFSMPVQSLVDNSTRTRLVVFVCIFFFTFSFVMTCNS